MATVYQDTEAAPDIEQLAGLMREAGGAENDFLPTERVAHYLARLADGSVRCIWAARDGMVGAAVLYSRFGPLHPIPGSYLRLEGVYVDEVMVTRDWRRNGWSRTLLDRLREVVGPGPDIYIDCDAANVASVAMMRSAGYAHVADYDDPDRAGPSPPYRTTSLFRQSGRLVRAEPAPAEGGMTVG